MKDRLSDTLIDGVLSGIRDKLIELREGYSWKSLFVDTGDFFIESKESSSAFQSDLMALFSESNMKEIAKELKGKSGFKLKELLHKLLKNLMNDYEIDPSIAETYIHHFMEVIFTYIEKNMPEEYTQNFLLEWRQQEDEEFIKMQSKLNELMKITQYLGKTKKNIFSIEEIDIKIRKETISPRIGLDFFEIDDEEFLNNFHKKIDQERIYIVGKSREETIYCILNEINKMKLNKNTIVVMSEEGWNQLENINNAILIPFFYANTVATITGNTNIFVFGEDEPCYSKERIILRKRTKSKLVNCLEKAGLSHREAFSLVEDTHGLYVPMRKKMFNGAIFQPSNINKFGIDVFVATLLCGMWKEYDGDIMILEELSGMSYDSLNKELLPYMKGENPFVVEVNGHRGKSIQLASLEDAWEELDGDITDNTWNNFINLLYEVLIESEPLFDYPFEKHFEASVYAKKPDWSPILKHGMVRSLIMRAYYRKHDENQYQVNNVVKRILDTITNKERWGYIAQYFTDLCEAAPGVVLEKLENELEHPTGMAELFGINDGDSITGRNYYTNILWAVEQLVLQKTYVVRAVKWLWKVDALNIKYSISNSPKSILETLFCAWTNISVLTVENKINLAKWAIDNYENAWDIIYSELPGQRNTIYSTLNKPRYRDIDEIAELYVSDVNKTYIEYINACLDKINCSADKWEKIISTMDQYDDDLVDEVFKKLSIDIMMMNDDNRILIKNKLRYEVYRHRYFADADWSIPESRISKFEDMMNYIKTENPIYEYLYLFSSKFDFPLLNPVPYEKENLDKNKREQNEILIEKEIEAGIKDFQNRDLSLRDLLELACKNEHSTLGECIAQYYGEQKYSEEIIRLMLDVNSDNRFVYNYTRYFARLDRNVIKDTLSLVKEKGGSTNLIVNLISLEPITERENSLIASEGEKIKREYWSRNMRLISLNDPETFMWAISECKKHGNLSSYLEIIFDAKNILNPVQIYNALLQFEGVRVENINSMTSYYLEGILNLLHNEFISDNEKSAKIAGVEWLFRNILDWSNMRCTQKLMKKSPIMYAKLAEIIYLKEGENKENKDEEQHKGVNAVFDIFNKAKFCPTENGGKVEYKNLKKWIDDFKEILVEQHQTKLFGHLVGRLLAYSPIGADNCMPCEAVRELIEGIYDDSLKSAYIISESNKRGVYTPNAGKTEMEMSRKYKYNADKIRDKSPFTAMIYDSLSDSYKSQANFERKSAEDEW